MLLVDVRNLRQGPVDTRGRIEPGDPLLEGLALELSQPLDVDGRLQATAEGEYFWKGHVRGEVHGSCRRCLTPLSMPVDAEIGVMFSADPDVQDDPDVFPLPATASQIDLGQAVRDELALTVEAFPLCREDCAGLCPKCGADLNAGPCVHSQGSDNT
jgi:uncharacterized protein